MKSKSEVQMIVDLIVKKKKNVSADQAGIAYAKIIAALREINEQEGK